MMMATVKTKTAPTRDAQLRGGRAKRLAQLRLAKAFEGIAKRLQVRKFIVELLPEGEVVISPVGLTKASFFSEEKRTSRSKPDHALAAARQRGGKRVAEILAEKDMLSADEMARLLGASRMTVNTKRRNHQLLGLQGAKRGYRFPQWQIGEDGKPFNALPALFHLLGDSPWAVYRFLVQHHAELGGLTGREALAKGRSTEAIEAAESVAESFS
jgi:hypothetical protein